jgi:hypothetical protein
MYTDQLVTEPLVVKDGYIRVPEKPGLGIEFNESALKYRVKSSEKPNADAIYAIVRPSGRKLWFPAEYGKHGYWTQSWAGNFPLFEGGVKLQQWINDGSSDWKDLSERLKNGPVWEG